jgi:hypothetical protein
MSPVIQRASKAEADDFPRTDWFGPETKPTVPGEYEARTGGGHVFRRKWTEKGWINSITGLVSNAPLDWRGVQPYSVTIALYPMTLRGLLHVPNDTASLSRPTQ